jgi:hypothetical protein
VFFHFRTDLMQLDARSAICFHLIRVSPFIKET